MKEIYVKEVPKSCKECPCSFQDVATCKWCNAYNKGKLTYISDDTYSKERFEDCPLKLLKDHDKELVAKVLKLVSIELENETETYCEIRQCNSPHYQGDYVWFNYVRFRKFAEKLQKEFEDE